MTEAAASKLVAPVRDVEPLASELDILYVLPLLTICPDWQVELPTQMCAGSHRPQGQNQKPTGS